MEEEKTKHIRSALTFSRETVGKIRDSLSRRLGERRDVCIVVVGSFGRQEASSQSDLDFFVIHEAAQLPEATAKEVVAMVLDAVEEQGIRRPSLDGAFGNCVSVESIVGQIGGADDDNKSLTRRMLFAFESDWLYNEAQYSDMFRQLISRYIRDEITQHQLCLFLLNDLIRYYRTICVDFEHKTNSGKKSWGDRNIKLMFSRKLLYFSGIVAIAETAQRTAAAKRAVLEKLLRLTPIDRVKAVCGASCSQVIERYDHFLGKLADESFRALLVNTSDDRKLHAEDFRLLKNDGHHFSWELARLLSITFDAAHPIHHAIKF